MTEAMIVIHLRNLLPRILSTLPEDSASNANASLFELAPSGVYHAEVGGLFSAALSVASLRLAVN